MFIHMSRMYVHIVKNIDIDIRHQTSNWVVEKQQQIALYLYQELQTITDFYLKQIRQQEFRNQLLLDTYVYVDRMNMYLYDKDK